MTSSTKTQAAPTPVRLPGTLKSELKAAAAENDRSLNGEIVNRLRWTFSAKYTAQIPTTKGQQ